MNKKPYSSAIKKTAYRYPITKKMASLMLDGYDRNEIEIKCIDENYIEVESPSIRRQVVSVIYPRLCSLDDYLLNEFYNGDVETSKFILVYAIAKTDPLFFEFMFEVYREALVGEKNYFSQDDFDAFFASKKENDPIVATWGDETIYCVSKGIKNVIKESGLGSKEGRRIISNHIMVHPAVAEHIELIGDYEYLKALLGVQ